MATFTLNGLSFGSFVGSNSDDFFGVDNSANLVIDALGGNDRIQGSGNFNITANGGDGNDVLRFANSTNITVIGGSGNDRLIGEFVVGFVAEGRGGDRDFFATRASTAFPTVTHRLTGGIGVDTFELPFYDNGRGRQIITDFQPGVDKFGVPNETLRGRDLNTFLANRVSFNASGQGNFPRTGESFRGTAILFNGDTSADVIALVVNTPVGVVQSNSNFVVTNSPFF